MYIKQIALSMNDLLHSETTLQRLPYIGFQSFSKLLVIRHLVAGFCSCLSLFQANPLARFILEFQKNRINRQHSPPTSIWLKWSNHIATIKNGLHTDCNVCSPVRFNTDGWQGSSAVSTWYLAYFSSLISSGLQMLISPTRDFYLETSLHLPTAFFSPVTYNHPY